MRYFSFYFALFSQRLQHTLLRLWVGFSNPATGQGLVEYSLILMLIAIVCVGILTMTGRTLSQVWYSKIIPAFPT